MVNGIPAWTTVGINVLSRLEVDKVIQIGLCSANGEVADVIPQTVLLRSGEIGALSSQSLVLLVLLISKVVNAENFNEAKEVLRPAIDRSRSQKNHVIRISRADGTASGGKVIQVIVSLVYDQNVSKTQIVECLRFLLPLAAKHAMRQCPNRHGATASDLTSPIVSD